jgi:hypothetical protein
VHHALIRFQWLAVDFLFVNKTGERRLLSGLQNGPYPYDLWTRLIDRSYILLQHYPHFFLLPI